MTRPPIEEIQNDLPHYFYSRTITDLCAYAISLEAQRDADRARTEELERHYKAAGPEHNLLELLDLYHDREMAAEARCAELEKERDLQSRARLDGLATCDDLRQLVAGTSVRVTRLEEALRRMVEWMPDDSDLEHWVDYAWCQYPNDDSADCTCSEEGRRATMQRMIADARAALAGGG